MTDPSQPLINGNHEAFAQRVSRGVTLADALRGTGASKAKNPRGAASELFQRPDIKARVAFLKDQYRDMLAVDDDVEEAPPKEWFMGKWRRNISRCELADDRAGVNANLEKLAKLCGYMVDRAEVTQHVSPINSLSPEHLMILVQYLQRQQPVVTITEAVETPSRLPAPEQPQEPEGASEAL